MVAPPSPSVTWPTGPEYPFRRSAAGRGATGFRSRAVSPGGTAATARPTSRPSWTCWRAGAGACRWPPPSTAPRSRRSGRGPSSPTCARQYPLLRPQVLSRAHAGVDEPRDRGRVRGARRRPGPLRGVPARAVPARVVRPLARARPHGAVRRRPRRLPLGAGARPADARGPGGGRRPARVAAQPRVAGRVRRSRPAGVPGGGRAPRPGRRRRRASARSRPSGRSTRRWSATPAGSPARWPTSCGPAGATRTSPPSRTRRARRRTSTGPRCSSTGWSPTSTRPADGCSS